MMNKKAIISILLLLTYSLGFSHNIIPHHHNAETEAHEHSHKDNSHSHHHHNTLNSEHEHISHGDHFDESLYDLIVCFLHENHQDGACEIEYYTPTKINRTTNKVQANKFAAILFSNPTETEINELFSDFQIDSEICLLSPLWENIPLRGPPTQKC